MSSKVLVKHEFWQSPIQLCTEGKAHAMHFRTISIKVIIFCKVTFFWLKKECFKSK
jgi:hypothetical protein